MPRTGRPGQEPDLAAREVLEVGPHDGVVVDDRVVVEDGAGDRVAAAQDRQAAERVVGGEERAADADPVMHRDDVAHPLDLVGSYSTHA